MKNLANCTPREFLKQTYRIKKSVENWLKVTDILNIRKKVPTLQPITNLSEEEKAKVIQENKAIMAKQMRENMLQILDKVLQEHSEETVELLALCCFVEPEDADNHTMSEYLNAIAELLSDQGVISFFTSLAQLDQMNSGAVSKQ